MSLSKMSLGTVVIKQIQYKLKAYISVFSSLVVLQVIAILFSIGGNGSGSSGSYGLSLDATIYTNLNVIIFTFLWIFAHAIMITTKVERENDFTFVANHFSNTLSNMAFLVIASIVGGITTILSGYLLRVIVYYFLESDLVIGSEFFYQPSEVYSGTAAMVFYLLLFSSLGYLFGTIAQLHRMLPVLLPILLIGLLFVLEQINVNLFLKTVEFYFQETNLLLFILKILVTSILCFAGANMVSNRLEVRR